MKFLYSLFINSDFECSLFGNFWFKYSWIKKFYFSNFCIRYILPLFLLSYVFLYQSCENSTSVSGTEVGNPENEIAVIAQQVKSMLADDSSGKLETYFNPSFLDPSPKANTLFLSKTGKSQALAEACTSYSVDLIIKTDTSLIFDTLIVKDTLLSRNQKTKMDTVLVASNSLITRTEYLSLDSLFIFDTTITERSIYHIDTTIQVNKHLDCRSGINIIPVNFLPAAGSYIKLDTTQKLALDSIQYSKPLALPVYYFSSSSSDSVYRVEGKNPVSISQSTSEILEISKLFSLNQGRAGLAQYRDADGDGYLYKNQGLATPQVLFQYIAENSSGKDSMVTEYDGGEDKQLESILDNRIKKFSLKEYRKNRISREVSIVPIYSSENPSNRIQLHRLEFPISDSILYQTDSITFLSQAGEVKDFNNTPTKKVRAIKFQNSPIVEAKIDITPSMDHSITELKIVEAKLLIKNSEAIELEGIINTSPEIFLEGKVKKEGTWYHFKVSPSGKVTLNKIKP